jgi:hypothetical protein
MRPKAQRGRRGPGRPCSVLPRCALRGAVAGVRSCSALLSSGALTRAIAFGNSRFVFAGTCTCKVFVLKKKKKKKKKGAIALHDGPLLVPALEERVPTLPGECVDVIAPLGEGGFGAVLEVGLRGNPAAQVIAVVRPLVPIMFSWYPEFWPGSVLPRCVLRGAVAGVRSCSALLSSGAMTRAIAFGNSRFVFEGTRTCKAFVPTKKKKKKPALRLALKVLKEGASLDARVDFIQEANSLYTLRHPNIIQLAAAIDSSADPPDLIGHLTELAVYGSLDAFMTTFGQHINLKMMVGLAINVVDGVLHIHSQAFGHFDIKLPNILVEADGEGGL